MLRRISILAVPKNGAIRKTIPKSITFKQSAQLKLIFRSSIRSLFTSKSKLCQKVPSTSPNNDDSFDPAFKKLDQSFNNPKEAFLSKYNSELLRAYFVFQMCSINIVVDKNKEVGLTI